MNLRNMPVHICIWVLGKGGRLWNTELQVATWTWARSGSNKLPDGLILHAVTNNLNLKGDAPSHAQPGLEGNSLSHAQNFLSALESLTQEVTEGRMFSQSNMQTSSASNLPVAAC